MQTKTLRERVANQKDKLSELAKTIRGQHQECGRDSEVHEPHFNSPVNWQNWQKGWDKGWGKYGKT